MFRIGSSYYGRNSRSGPAIVSMEGTSGPEGHIARSLID